MQVTVLAGDDGVVSSGTAMLEVSAQAFLGKRMRVHMPISMNTSMAVSLGPFHKAGGYRISAMLRIDGVPAAKGDAMLTVAKDIADDVRYGFYATFDSVGQDYDRKTELLTDVGINAVEFYDYFAVHGEYAPRHDTFKAELFDRSVVGDDVCRKIVALQQRGVQALAYVSAYAAGKSVFRDYPYPMLDQEGRRRVFRGLITTEEALREKSEEPWLTLMAIDSDSPWRKHFLAELKHTVGCGSEGSLGFDGFSMDSYGHASDERYYASQSTFSGQPLAKILAGLIAETQILVDRCRPDGLVTFNCVDEYAAEEMAPAVDFLFCEIWGHHRSRYAELADICYRQRAQLRKRVVLKIYPEDAEDKLPTWDPLRLSCLMSACISGGGSLMVAGEPDERNDCMHALRNLYYPDHRELPPEQTEIVRAYNRFDAMLLGFNHGANVENTDVEVRSDGIAARGFRSGDGALCVTLLRTGKNTQWTRPAVAIDPIEPARIRLRWERPEGPERVLYAAPDSPEYLVAKEIPWQRDGEFLDIDLPLLHILGVVILL